MQKMITYDTLFSFAYSNDRICTQPVRGIVLNFFGLGGMSMFHEDTDEGRFFAKQGIIYLVPYYNPWCWMNRAAVNYTDELIDVLLAHYDLADCLPVISTGGSMGGLSALTYMVYARHTPVACVANCPVCDLPYHYTERPDLPRTLYSAFFNYDGTMEEALKSASPLHLTEKMPNAQYCIFHCEQDMAVNKQMHSDRFVAALQKRMPVAYHSVPERGHCDLSPEARDMYNDFIIRAVLDFAPASHT